MTIGTQSWTFFAKKKYNDNPTAVDSRLRLSPKLAF